MLAACVHRRWGLLAGWSHECRQTKAWKGPWPVRLQPTGPQWLHAAGSNSDNWIIQNRHANQCAPLLWAAELGISLHLLVAASQCPLSIAPSHCYVTVAGILWKEGGVVDWWLLAGEESIDGKQMVAMVSSFLSPSSPAPPNYTFFFLFGWTLSWEDFKCLLSDLAPMIVHSAVQEMCVWKVSLEGKLGRARRNVTPMWVRGNKTAWPFCWLFSLAPWESTFSHTKRSWNVVNVEFVH